MPQRRADHLQIGGPAVEATAEDEHGSRIVTAGDDGEPAGAEHCGHGRGALGRAGQCECRGDPAVHTHLALVKRRQHRTAGGAGVCIEGMIDAGDGAGSVRRGHQAAWAHVRPRLPGLDITHRSEKARGQIEPVDIGSQGEAAGACRVQEPVPWSGCPDLVRVVLHRKAAQGAEHAAAGELLYGLVEGAVAEHQVYSQGDAVRGGRGDGPIKLGQAETERLIADDMLAGENGCQHERELTVGWYTECDDLDVGQRHNQRGIGVRARVGRQRRTRGQCVRVRIRYRDHLHPGHAQIGLNAEAPEGA